jgi:hypothetical protein
MAQRSILAPTGWIEPWLSASYGCPSWAMTPRAASASGFPSSGLSTPLRTRELDLLDEEVEHHGCDRLAVRELEEPERDLELGDEALGLPVPQITRPSMRRQGRQGSRSRPRYRVVLT